jgi:AraC-like DNA-binding protein
MSSSAQRARAHASGFLYLPVDARDIRREIYVTSVGRLSYSPGDSYPVPGHPDEYAFEWKSGRILGDFAIVLVEEGEGVFETQNLRRVAWHAGEVLLLPPGVWHRYRPSARTGWTESWCCLNGDLLHRFRAKGLFPAQPLLRTLSDMRVFKSAWRRLRAHAHRNTLLLAAHALETLAAAIEGRELRHVGVSYETTSDETVNMALEFIWYNCHRPLDVDTVARHVALTRRTLERRFATVQRRGVAHEIELARLQRARQMLGETGMSVKEVGYAAGFGGPTRLIRAFRKRFEMTPGDYRGQVGTSRVEVAGSATASARTAQR